MNHESRVVNWNPGEELVNFWLVGWGGGGPIVWAPPPLWGKFWLPPGWESEKLKKGVDVWCRGRSSYRGGQLTLFLFNFFKVYPFYIWKLFYPLQNCVMHFKKNYFFLKKKKITIVLWKGHSKLSKNEPENIP